MPLPTCNLGLQVAQGMRPLCVSPCLLSCGVLPVRDTDFACVECIGSRGVFVLCESNLLLNLVIFKRSIWNSSKDGGPGYKGGTPDLKSKF